MSETQQLEEYFSGMLKPEDSLIIEARLLIDTELREKALWQQRTYALVKEYGRKKLRMEIEKVHHRVFSEKRFHSFRQKVKLIFK